MTTAGLLSFGQVLPRLAGPLVLKDLRVASRQRKYYALRCAYVGLLLFVVLQLWLVVVHAGAAGSTVVQASRLADAGKTIVATIVWVQFIAGQILAAVFLSDAISGEIRKRTLETLLVSPLGAWQIVVGKLLSKLFQLVLLLAVSLPLLAVVRVFGGVPWDYVISGFCITLTAAVFAGSLSLFFSVRARHAYQAALLVWPCYFMIWGHVSILSLRVPYMPRPVGLSAWFLSNPIAVLVWQTRDMLGPAGATGARLPWPLHCLIILAAAGVCLALSVWRLRRVTRVLHWGFAGGSVRRTEARGPGARHSLRQQRLAARPIRRVEGPPIQWKQLQTSSLSLRREALLGIGGCALLGVPFFVVPTFYGRLTYAHFFGPIQCLQLLLVVQLAAAAGGAITREKEARTWPMLLTTPLSNHQIIKDKALGALRKDLPLLVSLAGFYLLAALLGPVNQSALVFTLALDVAGIVLFLLGVGLYLSLRLRTTEGAVAATLALYFAPRLFYRVYRDGFGIALFLLHVPVAKGGLATMLVISVIPMMVYGIAGLLGLRAATRQLRRNVF